MKFMTILIACTKEKKRSTYILHTKYFTKIKNILLGIASYVLDKQ